MKKKPCPPGEGGMADYAKNVKMKKPPAKTMEPPAEMPMKMSPPFKKKGKR